VPSVSIFARSPGRTAGSVRRRTRRPVRVQTECGDPRQLEPLRHCTRIAEHVGGLTDVPDDRDAADEIVRWITRTRDDEDFRVRCGQTADHGATEAVKEEEQDLRDVISTLIRDDPELPDHTEKAQEATTVFGTRSDLLEDAERFRQALSDG
jgi:hypothetical protein